MNEQLQNFARTQLKDGLARLPESHQRIFKLMYARDNGKRSVVDAEAMLINDVVNALEPEKLDWAMQQVENSIKKLAKAVS